MEGGRFDISTSHPFDVGSGVVFVFMEETGSDSGVGQRGSDSGGEPFLAANSRFVA